MIPRRSRASASASRRARSPKRGAGLGGLRGARRAAVLAPPSLRQAPGGGGLPVVRRWKFLIVGVATETEAEALAARLRHEAPEGTRVIAEGSGALAWQAGDGGRLRLPRRAGQLAGHPPRTAVQRGPPPSLVAAVHLRRRLPRTSSAIAGGSVTRVARGCGMPSARPGHSGVRGGRAPGRADPRGSGCGRVRPWPRPFAPASDAPCPVHCLGLPGASGATQAVRGGEP